MKLHLGLLSFLIILIPVDLHSAGKDDDETVFRPYGYVQVEDGLNISLQNGAQINKMLSPLVNISGGYNFTPVFGARMSLGYGQGRAYTDVERTFSYKYVDLFADATFDMRGIFEPPYNPFRKWAVFPYVGVGMLFGVENATPNIPVESVPLKWNPCKVFVGGRLGTFFTVSLAAGLQAVLDVNASIHDKSLRSGVSEKPAGMVGIKLGLAYSLENYYSRSAKRERAREKEVDQAQKEARMDARRIAITASAATVAARDKQIDSIQTEHLKMIKSTPIVHPNPDSIPSFKPYWYIQMEDGLGVSLQEGAPFTRMLSPLINVAGGYNFTPVFGARMSLGYGQGRAYTDVDRTFSYKYVDLFADATFDMRGIFEPPYNPFRKWAVFPYVGVGMLFGVENATPNIPAESVPLKWNPCKVFAAGRLGTFFTFNIGAGLQALVDVNGMIADKSLRSGVSGKITSMISAKIGLAYSFEHIAATNSKRRRDVDIEYNNEVSAARHEAKVAAREAVIAAAATKAAGDIAVASIAAGKNEPDTVYTFRPWGYLFLQDGLSVTLQQNSRPYQMLSPSINLGFGYNFTPIFGARVTGGFGQGKGYVPKTGRGYSFQFIELFGDATFNMRNIFEPYRPRRSWNIYTFVGIGPLFGLRMSNVTLADGGQGHLKPWNPGKVFCSGRVGAFATVNITPSLQAIGEVNFTFANKELKACYDDSWTSMCNVKLGLAYSFEEMVNNRTPKLERVQASMSNRTTNVSISTNFVDYALLGTLNVGADINLSRHVTLGFGGKYNPWVFGQNSERPVMDNQKMAYMTARYYPWYVFDGWHFDFLMGWQNYRTGGITRKEIEEGDRIGAGLTLGYSYILSKNCNLEFGAGFWMGSQQHKLYDKLDGNRTCLESGSKFYFLPSNITIGIAWVLNSTKTAKHDKGRRNSYE